MPAKTVRPLWFLAELTYACPLQCGHCSNPLNFPASSRAELTTEQWLSILQQARQLGSVQLGLSGGEPAARKDLVDIVSGARQMGFYTNLITSGMGLDETRLQALQQVGLDHLQLSFQAATASLNNQIAGIDSFAHKLKVARQVKAMGLPMVMNVVISRQNIHQMAEIIELAIELGADYLELANCQYYGWAMHNRAHLLPTQDQLRQAEAVAQRYRQQLGEQLTIYFVVPDYYENRPKACCDGWGTTFVAVTPDGKALPCQNAQILPGQAPSVLEQDLASIWRDSELFNRFRGDDWMREPCRSCPEKGVDYGGCRCQAYLLTGDAANTDPVCEYSPERDLIDKVISSQSRPHNTDQLDTGFLYRSPKNAGRWITKT